MTKSIDDLLRDDVDRETVEMIREIAGDLGTLLVRTIATGMTGKTGKQPMRDVRAGWEKLADKIILFALERS